MSAAGLMLDEGKKKGTQSRILDPTSERHRWREVRLLRALPQGVRPGSYVHRGSFCLQCIHTNSYCRPCVQTRSGRAAEATGRAASTVSLGAAKIGAATAGAGRHVRPAGCAQYRVLCRARAGRKYADCQRWSDQRNPVRPLPPDQVACASIAPLEERESAQQVAGPGLQKGWASSAV